MNVIKQILRDVPLDTTTIKMIVKDSERGPQGEKGDTGDAATIAAGNAYSVPAGSTPSVINTGTSSNAVFDFYIPKGDTGAQGPQGPQGIQGVPGAQGPKGDTGATGDRGPKGEDGTDGTSATVTVGTTTTLQPGEAATVTNTGTNMAAVLNFGIPKGAKGDKGDKGTKGDTGAAGRDGAVQYTAGTGIEITSSNVINATGSVSTTWGTIAGTLSNQTDLQTALNAKQNTLTAGDAITITGNTISADVVPADFFSAGDSVTGTGSTLTLNKTIEAPIQSIELDGNTSQQAYSGKNLIKVNDETKTNQSINYYRQYSPQINTTLEAGQTYTFSADVTIGGSVSSCRLTMGCGATTFMQDISGKEVTSGKAFVTFTPTAGQLASGTNFYFRFPYITGTTEGVDYSFKNVMLEKGATATDYEPYVGGIPSPNPDYPQDVNVVTGDQTVSVSGKNLASLETSSSKEIGGVPFTISNGIIHINGTLDNTSGSFYFDRFTVPNSGLATFWIEQAGYVDQSSGNGAILLQIADRGMSNWTTAKEIGIASIYSHSGTLTLDSSKDYRIRWYYANNNTYNNATIKVQLEMGDKVTQFDPYQTQTYTLSLGSIELCKIGTHQDYIYKNGDDWYVHKEIGKLVLDGSETYSYTTAYGGFRYKNESFNISDINPSKDLISSHFRVATTRGSENSGYPPIIKTYNSRADSIYIFICDGTSDENAFKTWLSNHNVTLYYALATPTDTQITDSTLVGQLNALAAGTSYLDVTNFAVAATGTNLPAILDVSVLRKSLAGMLASEPDLATVATSGSYNDLTNKPTIPTITMTSTDPGEGAALAANNFIAVYSE